MVERFFDFHGVRFSVSTSIPALGEAIDRRLRHYKSGPDTSSEFFFCYASAAEGSIERPSGEGRPFYVPEAGEALYFAESDALFIQHRSRLKLVCDVRGGHVRASVNGEEPHDLMILSQPFFTMPWLELLKRSGLYSIHAGCVSDRDGNGVVLAGASGAGKSTTTIALVEAGFAFLGDDTVFLRDISGRLCIVGFADEVGVSETTIGLFPRLGRARRQEPIGHWGKQQVALEDVYGSGITAADCAPSLLLFPEISEASEPAVEPMAPGDAMALLASNVVPTEPKASQRHLDALRDLVEAAPAYRLQPGKSSEKLGKLVAKLARSAAQSRTLD